MPDPQSVITFDEKGIPELLLRMMPADPLDRIQMRSCSTFFHRLITFDHIYWRQQMMTLLQNSYDIENAKEIIAAGLPWDHQDCMSIYFRLRGLLERHQCLYSRETSALRHKLCEKLDLPAFFQGVLYTPSRVIRDRGSKNKENQARYRQSIEAHWATLSATDRVDYWHWGLMAGNQPLCEILLSITPDLPFEIHQFLAALISGDVELIQWLRSTSVFKNFTQRVMIARTEDCLSAGIWIKNPEYFAAFWNELAYYSVQESALYKPGILAAARAGRLPIVQLIIEKGYKPDPATYRQLVFNAVYKEHIPVFEYLLKMGTPKQKAWSLALIDTIDTQPPLTDFQTLPFANQISEMLERLVSGADPADQNAWLVEVAGSEWTTFYCAEIAISDHFESYAMILNQKLAHARLASQEQDPCRVLTTTLDLPTYFKFFQGAVMTANVERLVAMAEFNPVLFQRGLAWFSRGLNANNAFVTANRAAWVETLEACIGLGDEALQLLAQCKEPTAAPSQTLR